MDGQDGQAGAKVARAAVTYAVGLVVLAGSITALYLGMRDVMEIGGSCASGGPYVVANPCPEGTGVLMFGGIFGWFIGGGLTLAGGSSLRGRYWTFGLLAWPGLFIALGWNFLQYGLDSPATGGGTDGGFLFCAVLFFLMGGLPVILGFKGLLRAIWPPAGDDVRPVWAPGKVAKKVPGAGVLEARIVSTGSGRRVRVAPATGPPPPPPPDDLPPDGWRPPVKPDASADADAGIVAELERLAALHASGALDDGEFERAKDRVLGGKDSA